VDDPKEDSSARQRKTSRKEKAENKLRRKDCGEKRRMETFH
jgi:hypothetical protein